MLKREKINNALKSIGKANGQHTSEFDNAAALRIKEAAAGNMAAVFFMLESSKNGLSAAGVKERLTIYGLNEVAHEKAPKWYVQFFEAFLNPFIGVLLALAIISLITDVIIQAPADKD